MRSLDTPWPTVSGMASFRPGTVTSVVSRPGAGRSTFTLNLALHNAMKGACTLYSSTELAGDMLTEKVATARFGIDLRYREIPIGGWDNFWAKTKAEMQATPLYLHEIHSDADLRESYALGTRASGRRGDRMDLWIIDSLPSQITDEGYDFEQSVSQAQRLAREQQIAVVVTSCVFDGREDSPVAACDVPATIAEQSDQILALHREGSYWRDSPEGTKATVTQLKPASEERATLHFSPAFCRFTEIMGVHM